MTLMLEEDVQTFAPRHLRYTRALYHSLDDAGIFNGAKVELIRGRLIEMPPMSDAHGMAAMLGGRTLRAIFPEDRYTVRSALPFIAIDESEPEPDFCVVSGSAETVQTHPSTCLLLVEISLATLAYDRTVKASLYAESGVAEYWIVNLVDRVVERHLTPTRGADGAWGYATVTRFAAGERCPIAAADGAAIDVAALLPTPRWTIARPR